MPIPTIGQVEVTIKVRFNADITIEQARKFVETVSIKLEDITGEVSIESNEVVADDIDDFLNAPKNTIDIPPTF